ncbi:MAG: FAD binding domain-containing protein [Candidatus Hydrogenedentales bacterium]
MEISRYERPKTMDEAYSLIVEQRGLPVAGGAWMHLTVKKTALAVDLSGLDLRYVRDVGDAIEIGAMATARDLETSSLLAAEFGNIFSEATSHLVGVQLRNVISVGGSVAGKFGFSDLVTVLTAMNASLRFYGGAMADISGFLAAPKDGPFFLEKIVVKKGAKAAFQSLRVTKNDFAVLNACASFAEGGWRIAVGARPAASRLSPAAADVLGREGAPAMEAAGRAGDAAAAELSFGDDTRGSAEYRRAVCAVLVKRAVMEASR